MLILRVNAMPKLIIRQNTPKTLTTLKITWVAVLGLILMIAGTLWWFQPQQENLLPLLSAADKTTQTQYQATQTKLNHLIQSFNRQFGQKQGSKNYHEQAITQADAILEQLNQLDEIVEQANLPSETLKTLNTAHQYQRDYWDTQRHFQELRLSRFEDEAILAGNPVNHKLPVELEADAVAPTAKKFQFATPPAGVELPADFCVPGASTCKAQ